MEKIGLEDLLPTGESEGLDNKVEIIMKQLAEKTSTMAKYTHLHMIQDKDETLFHSVLARNFQETLPVIYTPTISEACAEWWHNYRERQPSTGIYLSTHHLGRVEQILRNYPRKDIKVIVLTDGENILGLGDIGVNAMALTAAKSILCTSCAGIDPRHILPIVIDVGTENESIRKDPEYIGLRKERDLSHCYFDLIDELVVIAQRIYGKKCSFPVSRI
jgi:malate dehydrogenase (oxaloacetate-decarboxylating)(NADP+)